MVECTVPICYRLSHSCYILSPIINHYTHIYIHQKLLLSKYNKNKRGTINALSMCLIILLDLTAVLLEEKFHNSQEIIN